MDLDELSRLLEQATPGPWQQGMANGANANCVYKPVGPELHDIDAVVMVYGIPQNTRAEDVGERWSEGMANAALIAALRNAAEELVRDARRYRLVRRGQHWSVINGIGDELRAEALDAAIDAAIAQEQP